MQRFIQAWVILKRLQDQYRRGTWWLVSYTARDHRTKMRKAQMELGASARAIGY